MKLLSLQRQDLHLCKENVSGFVYACMCVFYVSVCYVEMVVTLVGKINNNNNKKKDTYICLCVCVCV